MSYYLTSLYPNINTGQVGASIVYTSEVRINFDILREDVAWLKKRYGLDEKGKSEGRVVIRYADCNLQ